MSAAQFDSVWDAIETTPGDAQSMRLRSSLLMTLQQHIASQGWTRDEAASRLGLAAPRVAGLIEGDLDQFGIDALVALLAAAGLRVELRVAAAA